MSWLVEDLHEDSGRVEALEKRVIEEGKQQLTGVFRGMKRRAGGQRAPGASGRQDGTPIRSQKPDV